MVLRPPDFARSRKRGNFVPLFARKATDIEKNCNRDRDSTRASENFDLVNSGAPSDEKRTSESVARARGEAAARRLTQANNKNDRGAAQRRADPGKVSCLFEKRKEKNKITDSGEFDPGSG